MRWRSWSLTTDITGRRSGICSASVQLPVTNWSGSRWLARPVARHYDDGHTVEVIRTATDGTDNANSMLYGACWRAAKALGYDRLITYTQAGESGASLRAAGWRVVAERPARPGWDVPSRRRQLRGTENVTRYLWEAS